MLEGVGRQLLVGKEDKDDKDELENKDVAEADIETESVVRSARPELFEGVWPTERWLEDLPVTASCLPRVIAKPWRGPDSIEARSSPSSSFFT